MGYPCTWRYLSTVEHFTNVAKFLHPKPLTSNYKPQTTNPGAFQGAILNPGHARLLSSKSHDGKGANGSKNRPHDAYLGDERSLAELGRAPVRCVEVRVSDTSCLGFAV